MNQKIIFIQDCFRRGLSQSRIAKLLGISRQRVHQIVRHYSSQVSPTIPDIILPDSLGNLIEVSRAGIKLQGIDRTRELVRRRDGYTCQICHKLWKSSERRFDVHHLNGNCGKKTKIYDRISDANYLITLCHKCHLSLESVKKKIVSGHKNGQDLSPTSLDTILLK